MAIELVCPKCSQHLRVGDGDAGKNARCPQCRHVFPVAAGSSGQSDVAAAQQWILRGTDRATYGPVSESELDLWVSEGRVTAECELRRVNETQWHSATSLYPHLDPSVAATGAQPVEYIPGSTNPYFSTATSPVAQTHTVGRTRPHRGATILVLGILGLFFNYCSCLIPGICAWYMGSEDLNAMRSGRMEASGYAITMTGMVLGMVSTVLHGLMFLASVFFTG